MSFNENRVFCDSANPDAPTRANAWACLTTNPVMPARVRSWADPLDTLLELWLAVRWALAGMGLFVASILWALTTSLSISGKRWGLTNANSPANSARQGKYKRR
jgi:hypothetical protein